MPSKEAMKLAEEAERLVTQGPTESEIADFEKMINALRASLTPVSMPKRQQRIKKKTKRSVRG